jgi:hypothetical protein
MNFPMDEPFFQFVYWLLNTPGLGGVAVGAIVATSLTAYAGALFWIARGGHGDKVGDEVGDEVETYAYPTPSLEHA